MLKEDSWDEYSEKFQGILQKSCNAHEWLVALANIYATGQTMILVPRPDFCQLVVPVQMQLLLFECGLSLLYGNEM